MVRTQMILDEQTYRALRALAFRKHKSMSQTLRELLRESLHISAPGKEKTYSFIGIASHRKKGRVSETHDEVLGNAEW